MTEDDVKDAWQDFSSTIVPSTESILRATVDNLGLRHLPSDALRLGFGDHLQSMMSEGLHILRERQGVARQQFMERMITDTGMDLNASD